MATLTQTSSITTPAFVVHEPNGEWVLEEVVLENPAPDEVLVEMLYSGICHTDEVIASGVMPVCKFPAIFGHEGTGIVRGLGPKVNRDLKPGDRVLLSINYCENCDFCQKNEPADCVHSFALHMFGTRLDGSTAGRLRGTETSVRSHFFGQSSFAKWSFVDQTCCVKVPEHVKDEDLPYLAAMGCGYQTGAGTVERILKPKPESSISIFGMGSVGLTAVMAAKYLDVQQIIGVDIVENRLELAREVGATHTINSRDVDDLVQEIKKLTPSGKGVDYAADCTGVAAAIEAMIESLGRYGVAAQVGLATPGSRASIDPVSFLASKKKYIGTTEGASDPPVYIPHLCRMFREGKFTVQKLCRVYAAKDLKLALQEMHEGKVTKPVLQW